MQRHPRPGGIVTSVLSTGLVTPLGLGREATTSGWWQGRCGLAPCDRWDTTGFPRQDAGAVPAFHPRKNLPDRKSVKIMSRESQLAVYAAVEACGGTDVVERSGIPAEDFGSFAAAGYEVSSLQDSEAMLAASRDPTKPGRLDVDRLFREARFLYNPLSPLKVLPNMALFHAGVTLGLRGPHLSLGSSPAAGLAALGEAVESLKAGHCSAALVLGSDAQIDEFRAQLLVEAGVVPRLAPGEGAAALFLGHPDRDPAAPRVVAWEIGQEPVGDGYGDVLDDGDTRSRLYEGVLERASGPIDLCLADLWDDPERDAAEHRALQGLSSLTAAPRTSRPALGWLGAAQGLVDFALAAESLRAGRASRALVTASGLAGDIAAVVLEAGP
ncbi:MAG: beta-ketoacyl synthase N-terminal-like domain-containing protein [Myxococcota bacterium]|nr:beta-ketoacyl synthase N-terminal-like domain-containing protein [Myxococcota bacterium]